jgi:putative DNA primase/helicase
MRALDTPADLAGVVILSAEDGLADTIRPRIEAAGGDPDRVECFAVGTLPFIPDDLTAIEEAALPSGWGRNSSARPTMAKD